MHAGSRFAWTVWLVVALVAAAGLRRYRVDNRLTEWAPAAEAPGVFSSYLVIGFPARLVASEELSAALCSRPTVALCIDPAMVATFGPLRDVTPQDFVVSPSGDFVGLFCFPSASATDERFLNDVSSALAEVLGPRAAEVNIGGPAVFHVELNAWSQRGLPQIVLGVTILGAVLLAWLTRRWRAAVAAMAGLVFSQIVLVGGLSWLAAPMDMSLSVVPPLMLSLGFSYAAHRATRYAIIRVLALCGGTTAAGIACFSANELAPIRQFAYVGVIGLGLAWLAVVTLVRPADGAASRPGAWQRIGRRLTLRAVERAPRTICGAACLLSVSAIPAAAFIHFDSDPLSYFPSDSTIVHDFRTLDDRLTGMLPFQLTVTGECTLEQILGDAPGIRKTLDVSGFVGGRGRTYWCLAQNNALPALVAAQPIWHARAAACGGAITWTGVAAQLASVSRTIMRTALLSLPLMVLLAAVVIGLLTRSWFLALLGAWVNVLPVFALVLFAALTRLPVGLPALLTGAIAVGMAIDDTVHIAGQLARGKSARRALVRCWRPCAGSTLVAAACLMLFTAAPFRPTAQFGLLLSFAALSALVADLLVLPAVLHLCGDNHFVSGARRNNESDR